MAYLPKTICKPSQSQYKTNSPACKHLYGVSSNVAITGKWSLYPIRSL